MHDTLPCDGRPPPDSPMLAEAERPSASGCDGNHLSPRGKRKGPRRRSQAQPSPRPRRLATEPSRTAEMYDQSRNVTWNQRHAGLHMPLAAPIAKVDEAGAHRNGRNAPPKPECNLESMTSRIAHAAGRPIAKAAETGTRPNGKNEPPKPECGLESRTSRIVHAAGRPIAKAGETDTAAQPDSGNEPPKPGSADLGCKSSGCSGEEMQPTAESGSRNSESPYCNAGLRCHRNRGYPSQRANCFTADSLFLATFPSILCPRQNNSGSSTGNLWAGAVLGRSEGSSAKKNGQNGRTKPLCCLESTT